MFHNSRHPSSKTRTDHITRVFTKLIMLEGNVRAAVRVTEHAGGGLLKFSDSVNYSHPQFGSISGTVLDALHMKYPESRSPPSSILPNMDGLPFFEEVKVTSSHIQSVADQLQGGAGPGGCDASHWQDILLRYGASSASLRDNIAALCHKLYNTITPWEDVRALVASRLIALEKCPGVRPIGIGETLRRIVGKTIFLALALMSL